LQKGEEVVEGRVYYGDKSRKRVLILKESLDNGDRQQRNLKKKGIHQTSAYPHPKGEQAIGMAAPWRGGRKGWGKKRKKCDSKMNYVKERSKSMRGKCSLPFVTGGENRKYKVRGENAEVVDCQQEVFGAGGVIAEICTNRG